MLMGTEKYREAEGRYWRETTGRQPDERVVRLAGLDTDVRVLEFGDGLPLLFIHGGPNAGSTWAPLVGELSGFRCLMVDRPGCGLSSPVKNAPRPVRRFMADLVAALLAQIDPSPIGVVASSFGSFAVLSHAVARPEDVPPTVHFGCPALVPGSKTPLRFLLQSLPGLGSVLLRLEPPNLKTAKKAFRQIGHAKAMDAGRIPEVGLLWYAVLLKETRTRENDLALFGRVRPKDMLSPAELGRISSPMSFYWGADDTFGGAQTALSVTEMIPGAGLEMSADSGHLPWMDAPAAAARHVQEFMDRVLAGGDASNE